MHSLAIIAANEITLEEALNYIAEFKKNFGDIVDQLSLLVNDGVGMKLAMYAKNEKLLFKIFRENSIHKSRSFLVEIDDLIGGSDLLLCIDFLRGSSWSKMMQYAQTIGLRRNFKIMYVKLSEDRKKLPEITCYNKPKISSIK